jgi:hypothetical protein
MMAGAETRRYTISYHAISLVERSFASDPHMRMATTWTRETLATPGRAVAVLLLYGCAITLAAILIFRRQDL